MPHSGSTYHLMCCCPSLLVGTTNTTTLLEYLKFESLMITSILDRLISVKLIYQTY